MDFQELYENYLILLIILLAEVVTLTVLTLTLIVVKVYDYYQSKREPYLKRSISLIILEALENVKGDPLEKSLKPFANEQILLYQTEAFSRRFQGGEWEEIKTVICNTFLIPRARKLYKSHLWAHRNYAARTFSLLPMLEDTDKILALLNDDVFLVRAIAAGAAVSLELPKAIEKIIHYMSQHEGYTYYFFRDLLINKSTVTVLEQIEEMAQQDKDPHIHLACLDILSGKSMIIKRPFLSKDLHSTDEKTRLAAVRIYAHNLQKESAVVLSLCIEDSYPEIRKEAALGLSHYLSEQTLKLLEKALSDGEWIVRLQAALSLKKLGKIGQQILDDQKSEENNIAYETAQYVTHFDS